MKRNRAIFCVVPDPKQQRFLSRVFPSWEHYARRHNFEIIIAKRSITNGRHPYWDRWLTIQPGQPEVESFDELLMLDNDIFIRKDTPNIFERWQSQAIGVVEESAQGPWDTATIPDYYRSFHVNPDSRLLNPRRVFNFGVTVLHRSNVHLFKELFDKWMAEIRPRFTSEELRQRDVFFRFEADGPFLSYELQSLGKLLPMDNRFNFFLPMWIEQSGTARLPFLIQTKIAQKVTGKIPGSTVRLATAHARWAMRRAANECYFLHMAGSKSPLWVLPDTDDFSKC